jgi:hypothetical protein
MSNTGAGNLDANFGRRGDDSGGSSSPVLNSEQLYKMAGWTDDDGMFEIRNVAKVTTKASGALFADMDEFDDEYDDEDDLDSKKTAEIIRSSFSALATAPLVEPKQPVESSTSTLSTSSTPASSTSVTVTTATEEKPIKKKDKKKKLEDDTGPVEVPKSMADIYKISNQNRKKNKAKKKLKSELQDADDQDDDDEGKDDDDMGSSKRSKQKDLKVITSEDTIKFMNKIGWLPETNDPFGIQYPPQPSSAVSTTGSVSSAAASATGGDQPLHQRKPSYDKSTQAKQKPINTPTIVPPNASNTIGAGNNLRQGTNPQQRQFIPFDYSSAQQVIGNPNGPPVGNQGGFFNPYGVAPHAPMGGHSRDHMRQKSNQRSMSFGSHNNSKSGGQWRR